MSDAELNTLASHADATTAVTCFDTPYFVPEYPDLHRACQKGDCDRIQEILENDPDAVNMVAHDGTFPLHIAASNNWIRACRLLISFGAAVDTLGGPMRASPLMWACRNGMVYIVRALVEHGAQFDGISDESGFSPLHLAVHSSNVMMVIYLVHLDVTLDTPDHDLRTPLHWAIAQGDHMSVETLLKAGANPNLTDGDGTPPLDLAISGGHLEIVKLLLLFGVDPAFAIRRVRDLGRDILWIRTIEQYSPVRYRFTGMIKPNTAAILTALIAAFIISTPPVFVKIMPLYIGVPLSLLTIFYGTRWLKAAIIPIKWPGEFGLMRSTYLIGIFAGIALMNYGLYLFQVLPYSFASNPSSCLFTLLLMVLLPYFHLKCIFMDPGFVYPGSVSERLSIINNLIDSGLYDSRYFCVHTYVPIPFRGCYDHYTEFVIARFDHYCPWLYNAIGIRNHRIFLLFIVLLTGSIGFVENQYIHFLKELPGTTFLVRAHSSKFSVCLMFLDFIFFAWLFLLSCIQSMQVATAYTSRELSSRRYQGNREIFSSIPRDHPQYVKNYGATEHPTKKFEEHKSRSSLFMRVFGLQQVVAIYRNLKHGSRNRFDNGVLTNCHDFWCAGGSILAPDGCIGAINGKNINYSNIIDYPNAK